MICCIYKKYCFTAIIAVCVFVFMAPEARGAQLFFESQTPTVSIGDELTVKVYLNTEDEVLNAFEGKVYFPRSLEFINASDGGSVVNLWVRKPAPDYFGIFFSGITPGGFYGNKGKIFDIKFKAVASGAGKIIFSDLSILKNDGLGTPAKINTAEFDFIINEGVGVRPKSVEQEANYWEDVDPPESFVPVVDRTPELFDNQWFISFAAQDKNSGINHYEKKSARSRLGLIFARWREVSSSYILSDQDLKSHILIKAVDNAGNERVESVEPAGRVAWYENLDVWVQTILLILVIIAVGIALKAGQKKFTRPV